jgi:branched-subunit amino acid ABC-type transport system permease component
VTILTQVLNGLQLGSIYALVALGYTMVYGIILLLNFAHGDIIMVGAYISWIVMSQLGLNPVLLPSSFRLQGALGLASSSTRSPTSRFARRRA